MNKRSQVNRLAPFLLASQKAHTKKLHFRVESALVLIETKGEHLKNDDSDTKVELGKLWQDCAGRNYRYIIVFDQTPVAGAVSWQDAIEMLKQV